MPVAQNGYTTFAPHFMARKCSYDEGSAECRNNCIHHGRYCAMDTISEAHASEFKPWQACPRLTSIAFMLSNLLVPVFLHACRLLHTMIPWHTSLTGTALLKQTHSLSHYRAVLCQVQA